MALSSSRISVRFGQIDILAPAQELAPDTRYQLWECMGDDCSRVITEFTTGEESDTTAPDLPMERSRDFEHRLREDSVALDVDFEGILVVDLGDADLRTELLSGSVHAVAIPEDLPIILGQGVCLDNWPGDLKDERPIRYGSFDLAGNFSGWTEPDPLAIKGCSTTGERPPPCMLLLLLASCRRRRR